MPDKKSTSSFLALLSVIALKGVKLVKVVKALKFAKILLSAGTMLLSIFAYYFRFSSWSFALGLVLLLFVHEMGHVIALRMKNYASSVPIFIPFFGALIFAPNMRSKEDESFMAYGGPLAGAIATIVLYALYLALPSRPPILLHLSFLSAILNLFNLIPFRPLDGGRILHIAGGWIVYVGIATLLTYITVVSRDPGMLVLMILFLDQSGLSPKRQHIAGVFLQTVMVAMIVAGLGTSGLFVEILDLLLATLLNVFFYANYKYWSGASQNQKEHGSDAPAETPIPAAARWKWLGLYLALTAFLITMMCLQYPLAHEMMQQMK